MQQGTDSERNADGWRSVKRRAIVLTALIVVLPLLWLLYGLHLPVVPQLALGLLGIGVLAVATAWTVAAVPRGARRA